MRMQRYRAPMCCRRDLRSSGERRRHQRPSGSVLLPRATGAGRRSRCSTTTTTGGHAKRNEFNHDGRMMLNGGTLTSKDPASTARRQWGCYGIGTTSMVRARSPPITTPTGRSARLRSLVQPRAVRRRSTAAGAPWAPAAGVVRVPDKTPLTSRRVATSPAPERRPARLSVRPRPDEKRKLMHMSYQGFRAGSKVSRRNWFHQTASDELSDAHRRHPVYYA
jgi:hypothetical protein